MDLSKIMNIQDGFLENRADLLFNYELRNSAAPKQRGDKKVQASLLSDRKTRMNENKRSGNRL